MDVPALQKRILSWYGKKARTLPWRKTGDPYRIWISEIMLQQTQIKKVIPYYERFLQRFPTVQSLARSPWTSVMDQWSGLGYYSRARNLHAAAKMICRDREGKLPGEPSELMKLPGIGRYTAGAIASIAFHRQVPILDGNVIRVLCRYFAVQGDPRSPDSQERLWKIARILVPADSPGIFNQALMELGALVCVPRHPICLSCPLSNGCAARRRGLQDKLPLARKAPPKKKIAYLCGILEKEGKFLLARRPLSGLLGGLWEFPGGEKNRKGAAARQLAAILRRRLGIRVTSASPIPAVRQILTHREILIRPFQCRWEGKIQNRDGYHKLTWVSKKDLLKKGLTSGMLRAAQAIGCLAALLFFSGCATVGPGIDQEELRQAHEFYQVKSKRHSYAQVLRVRTVGERLLATVPEELRQKNPRSSIGIILDDLTLTTGRVFSIPGIEPDPQAHKTSSPWRSKKGALIVGVIRGSPADKAGIEAGDLLLSIGSRGTPTVISAVKCLGSLKPGSRIIFSLQREGNLFERNVTIGKKPYPVSFSVSEENEVNAFAQPGQVVVTSGLLRFVQSDDELAVVLGHELAHLTRGHYAKRMGTDIVAGTIGTIAGIAVDIALPGIGDVISRFAAAGIRAPFSKDFEREADYFGLQYAYQAGFKVEAGISFWDRFATELPQSLSRSFFNTHPTSPERLLRLQKTIEEIKKEGLLKEGPAS